MAMLFLGFPAWLDKTFALISGLIIIIMAYTSLDFSSAKKRTGDVTYIEHRTEPRAPVSNASITSTPITSNNPQSN